MPNKLRYAVVGLGDIAQEAMLPAFSHTRNSELVALVTGDPEKAAKVGKQYSVSDTYSYVQFDELLASGKIDALYLATPNWRHLEFILPALKAGVHVLVEKPLEISSERCRAIMDAQAASQAKLMVAYRLHFEPATLSLLKKIRAGVLGEVHLFTATFAQLADPANHRAHNGELAGPVMDMGPYPVNAARYVFGAEPTEVSSAVATRHAGSLLGDLDDTVAVTLAFPDNRLAQFTVSYYGKGINTFAVVGSKGNIILNPGFTYGMALEQWIKTDSMSHEKFKATDQFGGELKYFSDCVLNDQTPEPDAEEGYADVRVLEAILQAVKTGGRVPLAPFERSRRIDPDAQAMMLSAVKPGRLVNASSPARDS